LKQTALYLSLFFCATGFYSCAQTNPSASGNVSTVNPASNDSIVLEKIIPGQFQFMEVDVLNNLYLITPTNQLKKLRANGDSLAVFNDVKKFGNPSLVDVTNPLKVLLYYKNFSSVVILDRMLSQRNTINFRQQNIFSVRAIATSYDNNIWLFDEQDFKLKKIDENGKTLQESTDWRLLMNDVPLPNTIIDANNFVYLYDKNKGFYIFDYYGTYKNNLPFMGWENVSISGKRLAGFSGKKYYTYELESLNLKSYQLPASFSNFSSIRTMNGKIYLLKKNGIEVYTVL
jgi:hypothetical protein